MQDFTSISAQCLDEEIAPKAVAEPIANENIESINELEEILSKRCCVLIIDRISFYTVAEKDFAGCEIFKFDRDNQNWIYSLRVP